MNLQATAPRDLLARAYLDMLAAEFGANSGPLLRSGEPDDPIERLIEDLSSAPKSVGRTAIRADLRPQLFLSPAPSNRSMTSPASCAVAVRLFRSPPTARKWSPWYGKC